MNFSVRGPHNTVPWVALIQDSSGEESPMLLWARNQEEAEDCIRAWNNPRRAPFPERVRLFRVDPEHHLGSARNAQLTLNNQYNFPRREVD